MYLRFVLSINIIHRNWTFSTAKNIFLLPAVGGCESGSLGWLLAAGGLVPYTLMAPPPNCRSDQTGRPPLVNIPTTTTQPLNSSKAELEL